VITTAAISRSSRPMSKRAHEIEIKLAVPDAKRGQRLLRAAGFRVSKGRVFESNTIFDTPKLALRKSRTLLRVREAGGVRTLTYKGRPDVAKHKSREELEIEISGARAMSIIFERLGFRPAFRYEKYRTEYRQGGSSGFATLDETPVGVYLELEGTPHWIDRTSRKLGFEEKDYITASYARLYLDWCERRGLKPTNMLFAYSRRGS